MKFVKNTLLCGLLVSCLVKNTSVSPVAPFYKLTISEKDIRTVKVEAILPLKNDTIQMSQSSYAPLKDGWAAFVEGLKATDPKGNVVTLTSIGPGIWKVSPLPAVIHLHYNIHIGHDTVTWKSSAAFARAYVTDTVLFFAGKTIFIATDAIENSKIPVYFNIPAEWSVVSSYADDAKNKNSFIASGLNDLWGNGNLIGRFIRRDITIGDTKVVIAGTAKMQEGVLLFAKAMSEIITTYDSIMGGAPKGKLVIMGSVAQLADGGEAFPHSISLMFRRPPDLSTKNRWAYLLSHEVFHLWNGVTITPFDQSDVEWFVEGFTDYMSKIVAYRTALINEAELLSQIAISYDRYLTLAGKISMKDAGAEKFKYFPLLYYGGMTAAIALDVDLRIKTKLIYGFPEIMRRMYTEFGKTNKKYSFNDIVQICNTISGEDITSFFNIYVSGREIISLEKILHKAGLKVSIQDNKTSISRMSDPSPEQQRLLAALLKK